jgi:hypothetical protein
MKAVTDHHVIRYARHVPRHGYSIASAISAV